MIEVSNERELLPITNVSSTPNLIKVISEIKHQGTHEDALIVVLIKR